VVRQLILPPAPPELAGIIELHIYGAIIISELSEENKNVVSKLIDAFLFQQEMKKKLAQ